LAQHRWDSCPGQVISCVQVEREHELIGFGISLPYGFSASKTADGIYQNIQTAVTSCDAIHQIAAGGFIGGGQRQEFELGVWANGITQRVSFIFFEVAGDYRRAFMQKSQSDCASQASCAAGDESYFAGESRIHWVLPL